MESYAPGQGTSRGYCRRRAFNKVHVLSWTIYLEKDGYVRCSFQNCNFMAFDVEEMKQHYSKCNGDSSFATYVCDYCNGRTTDKDKLNGHINLTHANELNIDVKENIKIIKMERSESPESGDNNNDNNDNDEEQPAPLEVPCLEEAFSSFVGKRPRPSLQNEISKVLSMSWKISKERYGYIKCPQCNLLSDSIECLSEHYIKCNKDVTFLEFECSQCKGRVSNRELLDKHMFECHSDTTSDNVYDDVIDHWKLQIKNSGFAKCCNNKCSFLHSDIGLMEIHYKSCLISTKIRAGIKCPSCTCWSSSKSSILIHEKYAHGLKHFSNNQNVSVKDQIAASINTYKRLIEESGGSGILEQQIQNSVKDEYTLSGMQRSLEIQSTVKCNTTLSSSAASGNLHSLQIQRISQDGNTKKCRGDASENDSTIHNETDNLILSKPHELFINYPEEETSNLSKEESGNYSDLNSPQKPSSVALLDTKHSEKDNNGSSVLGSHVFEETNLIQESGWIQSVDISSSRNSNSTENSNASDDRIQFEDQTKQGMRQKSNVNINEMDKSSNCLKLFVKNDEGNADLECYILPDILIPEITIETIAEDNHSKTENKHSKQNDEMNLKTVLSTDTSCKKSNLSDDRLLTDIDDNLNVHNSKSKLQCIKNKDKDETFMESHTLNSLKVNDKYLAESKMPKQYKGKKPQNIIEIELSNELKDSIEGKSAEEHSEAIISPFATVKKNSKPSVTESDNKEMKLLTGNNDPAFIITKSSVIDGKIISDDGEINNKLTTGNTSLVAIISHKSEELTSKNHVQNIESIDSESSLCAGPIGKSTIDKVADENAELMSNNNFKYSTGSGSICNSSSDPLIPDTYTESVFKKSNLQVNELSCNSDANVISKTKIDKTTPDTIAGSECTSIVKDRVEIDSKSNSDAGAASKLNVVSDNKTDSGCNSNVKCLHGIDSTCNSDAYLKSRREIHKISDNNSVPECYRNVENLEETDSICNSDVHVKRKSNIVCDDNLDTESNSNVKHPEPTSSASVDLLMKSVVNRVVVNNVESGCNSNVKKIEETDSSCNSGNIGSKSEGVKNDFTEVQNLPTENEVKLKSELKVGSEKNTILKISTEREDSYSKEIDNPSDEVSDLNNEFLVNDEILKNNGNKMNKNLEGVQTNSFQLINSSNTKHEISTSVKRNAIITKKCSTNNTLNNDCDNTSCETSTSENNDSLISNSGVGHTPVNEINISEIIPESVIRNVLKNEKYSKPSVENNIKHPKGFCVNTENNFLIQTNEPFQPQENSTVDKYYCEIKETVQINEDNCVPVNNRKKYMPKKSDLVKVDSEFTLKINTSSQEQLNMVESSTIEATSKNEIGEESIVKGDLEGCLKTTSRDRIHITEETSPAVNPTERSISFDVVSEKTKQVGLKNSDLVDKTKLSVNETSLENTAKNAKENFLYLEDNRSPIHVERVEIECSTPNSIILCNDSVPNVGDMTSTIAATDISVTTNMARKKIKRVRQNKSDLVSNISVITEKSSDDLNLIKTKLTVPDTGLDNTADNGGNKKDGSLEDHHNSKSVVAEIDYSTPRTNNSYGLDNEGETTPDVISTERSIPPDIIVSGKRKRGRPRKSDKAINKSNCEKSNDCINQKQDKTEYSLNETDLENTTGYRKENNSILQDNRASLNVERVGIEYSASKRKNSGRILNDEEPAPVMTDSERISTSSTVSQKRKRGRPKKIDKVSNILVNTEICNVNENQFKTKLSVNETDVENTSKNRIKGEVDAPFEDDSSTSVDVEIKHLTLKTTSSHKLSDVGETTPAVSVTEISIPPDTEISVKRKRGRPRKSDKASNQSNILFNSEILTDCANQDKAGLSINKKGLENTADCRKEGDLSIENNKAEIAERVEIRCSTRKAMNSDRLSKVKDMRPVITGSEESISTKSVKHQKGKRGRPKKCAIIKKRGRPRKCDTQKESSSNLDSSLSKDNFSSLSFTDLGVIKKRGRKKKIYTDFDTTTACEDNNLTDSILKAKRGRKKKIFADYETEFESESNSDLTSPVPKKKKIAIKYSSEEDDESIVTADIEAPGFRKRREARKKAYEEYETDDDLAFGDDDFDKVNLNTTELNTSLTDGTTDFPVKKKRGRKKKSELWVDDNVDTVEDRTNLLDSSAITPEQNQRKVVHRYKKKRRRLNYLSSDDEDYNDDDDEEEDEDYNVRRDVLKELEKHITPKDSEQVARFSKPRGKYRKIARRGKVSMVTCGVCFKEMTMIQYENHSSKHNYLCWIVGEKPIDPNNDEDIHQAFGKIRKYKNYQGFKCEKCGMYKKSSVGFISHRSTCGMSLAERESLKLPCHVCGRVMLPSSLKVHMTQEHKPKEPSNVMDDELDHTVRPLGKRAAASRAETKMEEYMRNEDIEDKPKVLLKLRRLYRHRQGKIIKRLQVRWKVLLEENKIINCNTPGCSFETNNFESMQSHVIGCPKNQEREFVCRLCGVVYSSDYAIEEHLLEAHKEHVQQDVDYEPSIKDIESDHDNLDDGNDDDEEEEEGGGDDAEEKELKEGPQEGDGRLYKKPLFVKQAIKLNNFGTEFIFNNIRNCTDWYIKNTPAEPIFDEFIPSLNTKLHEKEAIKYLPKELKSMKFSFKTDDWRQLNLFESCSIDDSRFIFVGGPVWALAWCPVPLNECHQWLATACHPEAKKVHPNGSRHSYNSVIQIWDCGILDNINELEIPSDPVLKMGIAHSHGAVWDLAWCPSGCYQPSFGRLGLLAAACSDGKVLVYSVPFNNTENKLPIYNLNPSLELVVGNEGSSQCCRLAWTREAPFNVLAVGYMDGSIALFNLSTSSPLLREGNTVNPHKVIQAHSEPVTGLHIIPKDKVKYLMSASLDRTVKFWNLSDTTTPVSVSKKFPVTDAVFANHWLCAINVCDDTYGIGVTSVALNNYRDYMYSTAIGWIAQTCLSWSITVSDWSNSIATAFENGDIYLVHPKQMIYLDEKTNRRSKKLLTTCKLKALTEEREKEDLKEEEIKMKSPYSYREAAENYGLIFGESDNTDYRCGKRGDPTKNYYQIKSVNKVSWNPNCRSFLYLAAGYHSGFVRIMKNPRYDSSKCIFKNIYENL